MGCRMVELMAEFLPHQGAALEAASVDLDNHHSCTNVHLHEADAAERGLRNGFLCDFISLRRDEFMCDTPSEML